MFKFLKNLLSEEDKKVFDVTVKPFIIYSIATVVLVILATRDIGKLNDDVAYGAFMSWITYVLILLFPKAQS